MSAEHFISTVVLEALEHGICRFDTELRVREWNSVLEKHGVSAGEARNRSLRDLLAPIIGDSGKLDEVLAAAKNSIDGKATSTLHRVAIDFPSSGQTFCDVVIAPLSADAREGMLIFRDISDASHVMDRFERIMNSTPDGLFVIDRNRKVQYFNESCGHITGRDPREIVESGCTCNDVIQCHTSEGESYAHNLCPARDVFKGEADTQREEMLLTNADGEERWIETTYSPIRNEAGEVDYVVGILRDVHERKLLEEKLHQTQKLASLGQLVAGIAHEIKNPLAIIMTSLDVMENPGRSMEQRADASRFIREEIRRMDERLRAFLAFARPRGLRLEPILLSSLVRKRVENMRDVFSNITIELDTHSPDPIVMGDEEQLQQLLTNLVLNAAEAMEVPGRIILRTRQQNDHCVIDVEDDGPGVPAEYISRIFDPFFTTKANGTGLGLSICYQIVLAHHGTISIVKPKSGKGACFSVRLPITTRFESVNANRDTLISSSTTG